MSKRNTKAGRSTPPSPCLSDVGVIGLVPDFWAAPWMPRHRVLSHLATYFNVVWVDPALGWRELCLNGRSGDSDAAFGDVVPPSFSVYKPEIWLPKLYRPRVLARFTEQQRLRRAKHILRNKRCGKYILYIWRPEYASALDLISHDLCCYHIDDEYTFSVTEEPLGEEEANLISRVGQVFIHSPALLEKKGNINPHTTYVPNGVDYRAYSRAAEEPSDLAPIPHPRIGYTGYLKNQLDWALLLGLAQEHPEWSFVFVGPPATQEEIEGIVKKMQRRPNVHFLGPKRVNDLAAYPQHFDICIMPYRMYDYTKYIYPLKLHEYLACGRPVVSSPIRSVQEFARVVRLARTAEEWSQALSDALAASGSVEQMEARRNVAREHDWDNLVWLIARTLCSRLGRTYLERFENLTRQQ